ncbi:response regulator [Tenacibaculum caenipelagi]|uniref:DNA-binding NarL/FixJ family response regulator n=1 Tax=Tenacibaculum caenipelagi TaxID=1325435 RepID=A0A4R6TK17_9FLAO|nr:response regulator [Tenacibaculum caenipelagi]TDQ29848.1 DNA-binding NarL/FixJ family response regulator [Tenacibaculum caenipelagi]
MGNKEYTALIIDDHPLISEAYKSAFNHVTKLNQHTTFNIHIAHNCDSAFTLLQEHINTSSQIDIVFLDMRLPPSKDGKILSGEDLGLKIKEMHPEAKIIVSTTFNDNYRVHSILKNINPDGFLVKNDITPHELVTAIQEVITDPPYYSKTITKLLRNEVTSDYLLDDIDRKIIHELSIGTRMKDLPEIVHLSIAAIEKRKRQMKLTFGIKSPDDKDLILIARDKGFI